jgi:hypothetical protein
MKRLHRQLQGDNSKGDNSKGDIGGGIAGTALLPTTAEDGTRGRPAEMAHAQAFSRSIPLVPPLGAPQRPSFLQPQRGSAEPRRSGLIRSRRCVAQGFDRGVSRANRSRCSAICS